MGSKGIHISIGLILFSSILLLVSLLLNWQHVSVLAGIASCNQGIVSMDMSQSFVAYMAPRSSAQAFSGSLIGGRNLVCGFEAHSQVARQLCQKFTMDYVVGILVIMIFLLAVCIQLVAGAYLFYYVTGRTKKEYRKVAFRCLCVAPVLQFVGCFGYFISLLITIISKLKVLSVVVPYVVTPGFGFIMAISAFFVSSFVPCLARQWVMAISEMIDSENRMFKQEARSHLLWDNSFRPKEVGHGAPQLDNTFCPQGYYPDPNAGYYADPYDQCNDMRQADNDPYAHAVDPYGADYGHGGPGYRGHSEHEGYPPSMGNLAAGNYYPSAQHPHY